MLADKMKQLFLAHMQLWTKTSTPGILCNSIFVIVQLLVLYFSIRFSLQVYGFILCKIYYFWAIMSWKGPLCHYEVTSATLTEWGVELQWPEPSAVLSTQLSQLDMVIAYAQEMNIGCNHRPVLARFSRSLRQICSFEHSESESSNQWSQIGKTYQPVHRFS